MKLIVMMGLVIIRNISISFVMTLFLKIFTENIEPEAVNQIYELIRTAPFENTKVRIMPDVH